VREIARLQSWLAAGAGVAEGGVAEGGGPAMADGAPAREGAREEEEVERRRPRVCFST